MLKLVFKNKMKNEKGMSHIMLLLSIIIIIGAAIGGMYFAKKEYEKYKLESLKTNMVTLQAKIKVLADEVSIKKEGVSYIGKALSENLEDEDVKMLIDKNVIVNTENEEDETQEESKANYEGYYILEAEDISKLGLSSAWASKVIVNYKTYEIIYAKRDGLFWQQSAKGDTPIIYSLNKNEFQIIY